MRVSRKVLSVGYAVVAVFALVGTWSHNLAYVGLGVLGTNIAFWQDSFANPASRSITVDLLFLVVAVAVWMLLEARRLRMRWAWLYIVLGAAIAISVTFPLFLIHRERALAREGTDVAGHLHAADVVGIAAIAAATIGYTAMSLSRAA